MMFRSGIEYTEYNTEEPNKNVNANQALPIARGRVGPTVGVASPWDGSGQCASRKQPSTYAA